MALNNTQKLKELLTKLNKLGDKSDESSNNLPLSFKLTLEEERYYAAMALHCHGIYLKEITEEDWKFILGKNGMNLIFVPNSDLTYDLCLEAVKQNNDALRLVPEHLQTKELCNLAVTLKYYTIAYICGKPGLISFETIKKIVKKDGLMIAFVKKSWGFSDDQMFELYKIAITQNPLTYDIIMNNNPTQYQILVIQKLAFKMSIESSNADISQEIRDLLQKYDVFVFHLIIMFEVGKNGHFSLGQLTFVENNS